MKPDGTNSLGGKKGTKASIHQGDPEIAYPSPDQLEEGAQCLLRQIRIIPAAEPNSKPRRVTLGVARTEMVAWSPTDKMRLLLIIALFILLGFCLITESSATSQITAVFALICASLFGRREPTRKSA